MFVQQTICKCSMHCSIICQLYTYNKAAAGYGCEFLQVFLSWFLPICCCLCTETQCLFTYTVTQGKTVTHRDTDVQEYIIELVLNTSFTVHPQFIHSSHLFLQKHTSWLLSAPSPTLWGVWAPSLWSCRVGSETKGLWPPEAFCSLSWPNWNREKQQVNLAILTLTIELLYMGKLDITLMAVSVHLSHYFLNLCQFYQFCCASSCLFPFLDKFWL